MDKDDKKSQIILKKWFEASMAHNVNCDDMCVCNGAYVEPKDFVDLVQGMGMEIFEWISDFKYTYGGGVHVVLAIDKKVELENAWKQ